MRDVAIGLIGVGWMGQLHTDSYRRVAYHYPECEALPRFVIAADEVAPRGRSRHMSGSSSTRPPTGERCSPIPRWRR